MVARFAVLGHPLSRTLVLAGALALGLPWTAARAGITVPPDGPLQHTDEPAADPADPATAPPSDNPIFDVFDGGADATTGPPPTACDGAAVGRETLATTRQLRRTVELGDWRQAWYLSNQLIELIEASVEPDLPPMLQSLIGTSCTPDALQALSVYFDKLGLEGPASDAVLARAALVDGEAGAEEHFAALVDQLDRLRNGGAETQLPDLPTELGSPIPATIWRAHGNPVFRFPETADRATLCQGAEGGAVRALLVGVWEIPALNLTFSGPANDLELIKTSLESRGVAPDKITTLSNPAKAQIHAAMRSLVEATRCGDFIVFYYTGGGPEYEEVTGWRGALAVGEVHKETPAADALLWGADVSEFITAIRNRRANILVALDTSFADGLDLRHFQGLADRASGHRWDGSTIDGSVFNATDTIELSVTALAPQRGDYAIFYGARVGQTVADGVAFKSADAADDSVEAERYGVFSFAFASTLQLAQDPSIAELAAMVSGTMNQLAEEDAGESFFGDQSPAFEASDPGIRFLGTASPRTLSVAILQPGALRGGMAFDAPDPRFTLVGRVDNPSRIGVLMVNNRQVALDATGQFEVNLRAEPGANTITIAAVTTRQEFQAKTITFNYEGREAELAPAGDRYALVIGNRDYEADDDFPDLVTPIADAREVADLLSGSYGFKLELAMGERAPLPLLLTDATREEMLGALRELERRLTEQDTLLIYYAGHGDIVRETDKAYWIPVDGQPGDRFSWIDSGDITESLKIMKAHSVLLVVDSCYAGAMTREPRELAYFDATSRQASLKKAAELKSRLFVSSGGVQPVNDQDKLIAGHSPFAAAFIEGLRSMPTRLANARLSPDHMFVTRELFNDFIYFQISGRYEQEPQFKQLENSGHLGGDFLFAYSPQ